jgi:hypothetical protein
MSGESPSTPQIEPAEALRAELREIATRLRTLADGVEHDANTLAPPPGLGDSHLAAARKVQQRVLSTVADLRLPDLIIVAALADELAIQTSRSET